MEFFNLTRYKENISMEIFNDGVLTGNGRFVLITLYFTVLICIFSNWYFKLHEKCKNSNWMYADKSGTTISCRKLRLFQRLSIFTTLPPFVFLLLYIEGPWWQGIAISFVSIVIGATFGGIIWAVLTLALYAVAKIFLVFTESYEDIRVLFSKPKDKDKK